MRMSGLAMAVLLPLHAAIAQVGAAGPPAHVRSISFRGNRSIGEAELRGVIATQQAPFLYRFGLTRWLGFGEPPTYDPVELRRDVLRIQALYGVRGFPQAEVDTTLRRDGRDLDITFRITEGPPIVVDTVQIVGLAPRERPSTVRKRLPLRAGAPFDRLALQTSVAVLEAMLRDRGYAFARVMGGFEASEEDPPKIVSVTLTADPGPRARIGRVEVVGTESVDHRVVLNTIGLEPGDTYSDSALRHATTRLVRTDLFRRIDVRLADSAPPRRADSVVDVLVRAQLAEHPLQRARVSAGYGTLDCFRSMATVDLFNFTGHGRRLELRARAAQLGVSNPTDWGFQYGPCPALANEDTSRLKLNYHVGATLYEPLLSWEHLRGMVTLYAERHTEFGAYLREALGGELALTHELAARTELRGAYSLAYGKTNATPATFCALLDVCVLQDQAIFRSRRRRSVIALAVSRDRTNALIDPTSGSTALAELRWLPRFLGSDPFVRASRFTFSYTSHTPLGRSGAAAGRVFSWRVSGGRVFAPREQLPSGPRRYAAPEERLYLGGSRTVRGFSEKQLGPVVHVIERDGSIRTSATGGTLMGLVNAELRIPFALFGKRLFAAVFTDAGFIAERWTAALRALRVTPGAGLRIPSVLGPIRIDLGVDPYPVSSGPLYRLVGSELQLVDSDFRPVRRFIDRLNLHLAIGQAF